MASSTSTSAATEKPGLGITAAPFPANLLAGTRGLSSANIAGASPAPEVTRGAFDGLTWTYGPGGAALLSAVPAQAWTSPAAQGWQLVKHNACREVWRAVIRGTPYFLKYYFSSRWRDAVTGWFRAPACEAEREGGLFALRAGIPAVHPIAYTRDVCRAPAAPQRDRGSRCALLITAAVEPAQPLNEFWLQVRSDPDLARRRCDTAELTELLAQMIARAHQAGFEHLDMHAANILVQPIAPRRYRTVFVDLQSARRGVPLSDRAVVRNLAQLNQWFRRHSTVGDRLRFLRAYLRWRGEFEDRCEHSRTLGLSFVQLVAALTAAARRHAQRLGRQRDHRVRRDGRYFTRLRLAGGWRGMAMVRCKQPQEESRASRLVFQRAWWEARLQELMLRWGQDAPPAAGDAPAPPSPAACKDSHSAWVGRAVLTHDAESLPVIVKRPRARNWRRRLAQLWPPSRSRRGWRLGHALLHRDIPTARPLAVLERRLGPFVLESFLVTEAIPGAVDLATFLRREHATRTPAAWVQCKRELLPRLVTLLRRLHERGFDHRDCKASNILVVPYPELRLLWIDLDGVRYAGNVASLRLLRPLARLHVSLLDIPGLTRTDRVRFLQAYSARYGSPPDAWRAAWPALRDAARRAEDAHERRRGWKLAHYGRP